MKDQNIKDEDSRLTVEIAEEPEKKTAGKEDSDKGKGNKEEAPSLKQVIKETATEDEKPLSKNFTLSKVLGGDILATAAIRRMIWVVLLITGFLILYISNRYSCQKKMIEIDKLQKELVHAKYKALASSSQLTEKCRESHILEMLKANNDTTLKIPKQPPFIIKVPQK